MPTRKSGFTLIELLVVIAIISVLAAILFPVFSKTQQKARQTSCASNARQLAMGIFMYAQDYDGMLLPTAYTNSNGDDVLWIQTVSPYVKSQPVTVCPSDFRSTVCSYGLNEILFSDQTDPASIRNPIRNLASIDAPSSTVMLGETGTGDDFSTQRPDTYKLTAPSYPLNDQEDARPAARHNGYVSVSFMDGHEKEMKLDQFYLNQTPMDKWFLARIE